MTESDDSSLLREFAASASETAFAGLVERHVNLVYATALRCAGTTHAAEEISQAVFIILAQKAGKLSSRVVLSGWLYQTTRLTAANFLRGEIRRQQREQEAYMQSTLNEADENVWPQIAPLLDGALEKLGDRDRNAIVLRFLENKTLREVGAALETSEDAAKMRVNRAVEKLRKIFGKRGVTLSAALIAGTVAAGSVQAAPAGLAATISVTSVKGAAVTATVGTLVKGTLKLMTYAKLKLALGITAGILLAAGATTLAISQPSNDKMTADEIFQKARAAYASLDSYSDEGQTIATLNGTTITHKFTIKLARPNLYRIEWEQSTESATYKSTSSKGVVWSAGAGDFLDMGFGGVEKQKDQETALSSATGISGGAAATIPGTFFKMKWGNQLGGSLAGEKRQADEKVGDVDCYVFTSENKGRVKTIWIGKQDFLIHQVRTLTSAEAMKAALRQAAKVTPVMDARLAEMEKTVSDSTSTETHEHIIVNQKFSPADFVR